MGFQRLNYLLILIFSLIFNPSKFEDISQKHLHFFVWKFPVNVLPDLATCNIV